MERLGSPRIQDGGRHELEVMLYGDLNPVRARMVRRPRDWPWSSHAHYAFGRRDPLVSDSPAYLALGRGPVERMAAYLRLFTQRIASRVRRHRPDLVGRPFFGSAVWMARKLAATEGLPSG